MSRKQLTDRPQKKEWKVMLGVPLPRIVRQTVVEMAEAEERTPASMGRVLIQEAIEARKEAAAAGK